jgi:uncharacterized protein YutE (UPF0331/DUF86 family)
MTDLELVAKKLAEIETFVAELRSLGRPELVVSDLRERRFIEHTLQLAIRAALDAASHIVSGERWGEPESYAALFSLLATHAVLPVDLAPRLRQMAGFRNLLVHGYARIDPHVVARVATSDVQDLLDFVEAVRLALALRQK